MLKPDRKLAELLQCGLQKGRFVPPQWPRELRDLTATGELGAGSEPH
jgi:hypothetical protein